MSLDVSALKEQIEKEKESLKNVDENIKKITGRDPNEPRQGIDTRRISLGSGVRRQDVPNLTLRRRRNVESKDVDRDLEPPRKRPAVFSRLGGLSGERRATIRRSSVQDKEEEEEDDEEEELATKPAVQSSVVSTAKKITRDQLINAQNVGEKGKARNRRMFGMLLGTLARFSADGQGRQSKQALKQKEVESRLEEQNEQERRKLASERKTLFTERRMQQRRINLMEEKIALANELEEWEKEWEIKSHSIMTKASPSIFFLPTGFTPRTQRALQESKERIKGLVEKRKVSVADTMRAYDDEIKFLENKQDGNDNGKGGVRNGAGAGRAGRKGGKIDDEPEEEMDLDSMEHHVDIKVDVDDAERNGRDVDKNEAPERGSKVSHDVDEAPVNNINENSEVQDDAAGTSDKNKDGEKVEKLTDDKLENVEEMEQQPDGGKGSIVSENNEDEGKDDDATKDTRSEHVNDAPPCSDGEGKDAESENETKPPADADIVVPDVESTGQDSGVTENESNDKTGEKQSLTDKELAIKATAAATSSSSSSESEGEKSKKKGKKSAPRKRKQSSSDSDSSSSSASSSSSDEKSKKAASGSRSRVSRDSYRSNRRGRDRSRSRERRDSRRDRNRR